MDTGSDLSIGKIEKPLAKDIMAKRKAYLVRLMPPLAGVRKDYQTLSREYWREVEEHLAQLELKAGIVKKIYAEGIPGKGEDAKVAIQNAYPLTSEIVTLRLNSGAKFDLMEDEEILASVIDWSRFLESPFASRKVADKATAFYTEAVTERVRFQTKTLDKGLGQGEAALVFVGSFEINLPKGIERFVISPPALDKIDHWMRTEGERMRQAAMAEQSRRPRPPAEQEQQERANRTTEGGLWLPD